MKAFPGTIENKGRFQRKVLNDEQLEWLRRWYPVTENVRLAKAMGIGLGKLTDFVKEYNLKKSEAGMKAIKRRQTKAMTKANHKNGCYDRKRGHPPSDATLEGIRRRWDEFRAGLRDSPFGALKKRDPERYKSVMAMRSKNRRELVYKEKRRMIYGMERKTNLTNLVMKPYTRSQICHRSNALLHGYLLDEDCSEGQPGRYVIYYDDETNRSARFEKNCIADGFRFERDE